MFIQTLFKHYSNTIKTHGESTSLNVKSRSEDAKVIEEILSTKLLRGRVKKYSNIYVLTNKVTEQLDDVTSFTSKEDLDSPETFGDYY